MNDKPYYKHDCDKCVFLGAVAAGDKLVDLYLCAGSFPEVIARYSDRGEDCRSGMPFADLDWDQSTVVCGNGTIAELVVARELAIRRGLYDPNQEGGIKPYKPMQKGGRR
jgi:hypothetical protein